MNISVPEPITAIDDELVERALLLLPEIGRRLYATKVQHPALAGTSMAQVKAMMLLSQHGRRTIGEVADGLGVSMPAASELVDRLVEAGLAERGTNPADRRQVLVWLTPEAERLSAEMRAVRRAQLRAALANLAPAERPVFLRSLEALADALRRDPAELVAAARAEQTTAGRSG